MPKPKTVVVSLILALALSLILTAQTAKPEAFKLADLQQMFTAMDVPFKAAINAELSTLVLTASVPLVQDRRAYYLQQASAALNYYLQSHGIKAESLPFTLMSIDSLGTAKIIDLDPAKLKLENAKRLPDLFVLQKSPSLK